MLKKNAPTIQGNNNSKSSTYILKNDNITSKGWRCSIRDKKGSCKEEKGVGLYLIRCTSVCLTCSGLRPGGAQAYSSRAQPESSSEVEFLWKSYMSLVTGVFSISSGISVRTCSSPGPSQQHTTTAGL